ncbi:MAG: aldose epimerase family protein [Candidatus Acidiferrales bacterium]
MRKKGFGKTEDGTETELYTLTNRNGLEASIATYGGILMSLLVPDKRARLVDIVLGHDALDAYLRDNAYLGASLGRYANRIAGGKFTLNGKNFTVARNNGENHLHGGLKGFNRVVWKAKDISTKQADALDLTYLSPDGEEGYPGNLSARVVYTLTGENELKIDYSATSDRDTVINLTNHTYFNLAGHAAGSILNHELTIHADRFTPTDATSIPTGELRSVKGTPFDFSRPTAIGLRVNQNDPQLIYGHGYDQNFVLNQGIGAAPALAARVLEPESGRVLEVWTTEPGMQLYCGNFLDGSIHGKGGAVYQRNQGFCLETQHFPDSPNQPSFPSTVLKAGGQYRSTTIFKFLA